MNTHEHVSLARTDYLHSHKTLTVLIVVLASFTIGLIPVIAGSNSQQTPNAIPTEAGLWNSLGEK